MPQAFSSCCPHEPLELLQLGGVADEDVLRHRVEFLGDPDRLADVLDHPVIYQIEGGQVRLHRVPAHRVVVPGAVLENRSRRALR